ncbi:MAG: iron-sulfur binding hydrogenase [Spirochaetota bacterium]
MKLGALPEKLGYTPLTEFDRQTSVSHGYTSDLLSDVMGNAPENAVLITIQAHKNTVAVASLVGMKAILLCSGRQASEEMLLAAVKEGIAIFATEDDQFTASCKIGALLS